LSEAAPSEEIIAKPCDVKVDVPLHDAIAAKQALLDEQPA
jgi:hypothetical protein